MQSLLYSLDDKPQFSHALTAALQHVLASFVGIITPTLIIGAVLGLDSEIPYLLSMALIISGVSTFVQVKRFGPVGSGLVSVQGTSFAFLGALITAGTLVRANGGTDEDVLAMLLGVCLAGAFIEIAISQWISYLRRVITPVVTGIVIITIGISLIKVGMTDLAGGFGADSFGNPANLIMGFGVLFLIIFLNASNNPWVRLSAIVIGMLSGSIIGYGLGLFTLPSLPEQAFITVPIPFKYGISFEWEIFLPVAFIYFLTAIETSGDLTATSHFCGLPVQGPDYIKRIKGGVLADGINSLMAAVFNTFPNTTFGQNNAVIQMTGVASRHVGFYVAGLLVLLGLFPVVGAILQLIPKPVLGGATLVMFGTVAVAGVSLLTREPLDRRATLIVATSLGLGLGSMMVPDLLKETPELLRVSLSSPVAVAGLTAISLTLLLPTAKQPAAETA